MSQDSDRLQIAEQENIELVSVFFRALEERDIEKWQSFWAEDGVYLNPFTSELFPDEKTEGREKICRAFQVMPDVFSDVKLLNLEIFQTMRPEILYAECDSAFTFKQDGFVYRNRILHKLEVKDGKVKTWVEYVDPIKREAAFRRVLQKN